MEVPAPFAGTVTGLSATPGTKVQVGQVVLTYNPVGEPQETGDGSQEPGARSQEAGDNRPTERVPLAPVSRPLSPSQANGRNGPAAVALPPAAPSVRMLARKLGIDLATVRGSGPHG